MYKRQVTRPEPLEGKALTAAMVGIGMNIAGSPARSPNIEDTLLFASKAGMQDHDLRVLSVLVTWLGVHSAWINADRLTRLLAQETGSRVRAFWAGVAHWLKTDRRFGRLANLHAGPRLDLLPTGTDFQVARYGEDPRFEGGPLRVPANVLRDRPADVLSPVDLAERHGAYRQRVIMGPSYRADIWGALEADPTLSAAELARRSYGSFATAWQVKRDWALLNGGARNEPAEPGRVRRSEALHPKILIGSTVSTAGGLEKAFGFARDWGLDCIQIGVGPPLSWEVPPLNGQSVERFRRAWEASDVKQVVGHATHLVNLASPHEETVRNSIARLVHETERAAALKVAGIVFHPGSTCGHPMEAAMDQVVRGIDEVLERTPNAEVQLLLETMAGKKHSIGSRFEELRYIIDRVSCPDRIGVCVDTCHLFDAGYDLRGVDGFSKVLTELDEVVGISNVKALHLNDSLHDLGSGKDRHCSIGKGSLGLEVFRAILHSEELLGLPMIVENLSAGRVSPKVLATLRKEDVETLRTLENGRRALCRRDEKATKSRDERRYPRLVKESVEPGRWHEMPDQLDCIGKTPGSYILEFDLAEKVTIHPSECLGEISLGPGRVRYYGNAGGGLKGRIKQHVENIMRKKRRTDGRHVHHIDSLTEKHPVARVMITSRFDECGLFQRDLKSGLWTVVAERFGSTDCKRRPKCQAHVLVEATTTLRSTTPQSRARDRLGRQPIVSVTDLAVAVHHREHDAPTDFLHRPELPASLCQCDAVDARTR